MEIILIAFAILGALSGVGLSLHALIRLRKSPKDR